MVNYELNIEEMKEKEKSSSHLLRLIFKKIFLLAVFLGAVSLTYAAPIGISVVSNLVFDAAEQGASLQTIASGSSETASNASFLITGDASTAYTITLPTTIDMTVGSGSGPTTIAVDNFESNPAAGANGLLDGSGNQTIYIGARRAALAADQSTGAYSGTFTVTVVY